MNRDAVRRRTEPGTYRFMETVVGRPEQLADFFSSRSNAVCIEPSMITGLPKTLRYMTSPVNK